jgi:hypothetical protein
MMRCAKFLRLFAPVCLALQALMPCAAQAQGAPDRVRITNLSDVAFGSLINSTTDITISQSICVHTRPAGSLYDVTATGSGSAGAFTLASGANTMAYEVQWAASPGQSVGTSLAPGLPLTGLPNGSNKTTCSGGGPPTTASLITILRASAIGLAAAGTYTGTLTVLITPT